MDSEQYIQHFEDSFYNTVYDRWRIQQEKAGKDIVGEQYETFRAEVYKNYGFDVVEDKKKKTIGGYDADLVIEKDGEVVIVEEAKGHYVDSCFLQRAVSSYAKVIDSYLSQDRSPPYFVLSCPTKMNNFSEVFEKQVSLYREDIRQYLKAKFLYMPICSHGRVSRKQYYATQTNCFMLDKTLVDEQILFLESLKDEG